MGTKKNSVSFCMQKELQKYMTPQSKNFALVTWYRYMFPYIPFNAGILASTMSLPEDDNSIKLSPEQAMQIGIESIQNDPRNVIHFRVPYASTQYDGENFNFRTDQHELAQAKWGQVAADLHGEQIVKEVKKYVKRSENK
jgi:hypothetical protein